MSDQKSTKSIRSFKPSAWSVDNGMTIFLLTFMIFLFGFQSYNSMPKEQFPEIVIPTVYINTVYSGNSAEDMENLVTRYVEKEVKSISGVKKIESTSQQDISIVIVEFNTDVDVSEAVLDVKDALDKAEADLPNDLTSGPTALEVNFSDIPIMTLNISGNYSEDELRGYAEYLRDLIERLSEINEVEIKGVLEREIRVDIDLAAMQSREVSFGDIEMAIRSENVTLSAGDMINNGSLRSVRVVGEFKTIDDLRNLIIKSEFQNSILLSDIATVYEGFADVKSISRSDKLPVVSLDIKKRSGENLLSAADKIKAIVKKAKATKLPKALKVSVFNDQSVNTRNQVSNLENSIIFGVILVVLVLLFFLGLRNSLFVGIAIPLSMLMGILILNLMGITLNIIVLFSLILALGLLVDNAIVVVENIYRYMQEGYEPYEAAKRGASEVAVAIITSTLTTLAAFFPLMFWPGIMGEFMKYLPLTLIIVLSSSLFVALVINPVLTSRLMKVDEAADTKEEFRRRARNVIIWAFVLGIIAALSHMQNVGWMRNASAITALLILVNFFILRPGTFFFQNKVLPALESGYDKFISFALKGFMPFVIFAGTFVLLIFSIWLLTVNAPKVILFPDGDPIYVNAFIELPIGTDIRATDGIVKDLESKVIDAVAPYRGIIEDLLVQIGEGTSDPGGPPEQGSLPYKARITVSFVPSENRGGVSTFDVMTKIREALSGYAGVDVVVAKNANGPPTGKPISLEISGEDMEMEKLLSAAGEVRSFFKTLNIPGVEELKMDVLLGKKEDQIKIDRKAARRFGISTGQIAQSLRASVFGSEVTKFKVGEEEYPIMLRLKEEDRYNQSTLLNQKITFRNPANGQISQVPISTVAGIDRTSTYNAIKRKDLKRTVTIFSEVITGFNANEIVDEMKDKMADYKLPEGITYKFSGQQAEQAENSAFLVRAFMIALFAIFIILVTQFNSFLAPLIIVISILFSTIGVFFGYVASGMDFVVVMTGIGIISLAGIVVNNAIVLMDYINLLRKERREAQDMKKGEELTDAEVKQAIIDGGRTRLRPVLLTAITTILGLVPLAVGMNFDFGSFISNLDPNYFQGGDNAALWGPMAWTVIYGLTFATFLTLVVVPVMYWMMFKVERAIWGRKLKTVDAPVVETKLPKGK